MAASTVRWVSVGLLASACAVLLEAASTLNAGSALADDTTTNTALIMGDALLATPNDTYLDQVMDTYIDPATPYFTGQTVYPDAVAVGQYTPETGYGEGLTQGVADLNSGITQYLADGGVVVFGYSESTSVATQEMVNLDAEGAPNSDASGADPLSFVLLEDLNNPDGGYFTRFPSFGLPATPGDTPYTTDIYSIEYSAASDFPQYDSDLLADINAEAGFVELHPYLLADYPSTYTASELSGAVLDPNVSAADVNTDYYLIPTQDLPMLTGIQDVSPALADLIQPDLRVLVDLGYDWTGDADVATAATSTAPDIDTTAVDADLAAGADQGMIAALVDMGVLPESDLSDLYPYVPDVAGLESSDLSPLTSDTVATADASASLAALTSDLSTSDLAGESTFLTAAATDLADLFTNSLGSLYF
jgi:diacyltrehalose acyltransferase